MCALGGNVPPNDTPRPPPTFVCIPTAPAPAVLEGEMHDVPDVVLVDDDDHYREALSADLADRGFSVSCFADGPSFLEALSNGVEAQVALLDWVLPEMSGFELLGALREQRIELPVVFLTGYSVAERELQALDRGAVDFVDKARGTEVLAHRLRVIIEGQRALAAARGARDRAPRRPEPASFHGARPVAAARYRSDRSRNTKSWCGWCHTRDSRRRTAPSTTRPTMPASSPAAASTGTTPMSVRS